MGKFTSVVCAFSQLSGQSASCVDTLPDVLITLSGNESFQMTWFNEITWALTYSFKCHQTIQTLVFEIHLCLLCFPSDNSINSFWPRGANSGKCYYLTKRGYSRWFQGLDRKENWLKSVVINSLESKYSIECCQKEPTKEFDQKCSSVKQNYCTNKVIVGITLCDSRHHQYRDWVRIAHFPPKIPLTLSYDARFPQCNFLTTRSKILAILVIKLLKE